MSSPHNNRPTPLLHRRTIALFSVLATLAALLFATPSALADDGPFVDIAVTSRGNLIVEVLQPDLSIYLHGTFDTEHTIIVDNALGETLLIESVQGIVGDVTILTDQRTGVQVGRAESLTMIFGTLRIVGEGNQPGDIGSPVVITRADIRGDIVVAGVYQLQILNVSVHNAVRVTQVGVNSYALLSGSYVAGRVTVRPLDDASMIDWYQVDSVMDELHVTGGPLLDQIRIERGDIGDDPTTNLGDNDDYVILDSTRWEGLFTVKTGRGDDHVWLLGELAATVVALGAGDDSVTLAATVDGTRPSLVTGRSGVDTLYVGATTTLVPIRSIELVSHAG